MEEKTLEIAKKLDKARAEYNKKSDENHARYISERDRLDKEYNENYEKTMSAFHEMVKGN